MKKEIAKILLDIKAVHLQPDDFFTWTSGIKSPIYCDNRQIISYLEFRRFISKEFASLIKRKFEETDIIAGTSTAGIPWAAWIADILELPMIYIRSNSKGHGLKNALEGKIEAGKNVVVIEDLISTGKSSIAAAKEVSAAQMNLQGVVSIFDYDLDCSKAAFTEADIQYHSLCNLPLMLEFAKEQNLLSSDQIDIITKWKNSIKIN
jgi:orotate phosphoribosyltransferase